MMGRGGEAGGEKTEPNGIYGIHFRYENLLFFYVH